MKIRLLTLTRVTRRFLLTTNSSRHIKSVLHRLRRWHWNCIVIIIIESNIDAVHQATSVKQNCIRVGEQRLGSKEPTRFSTKVVEPSLRQLGTLGLRHNDIGASVETMLARDIRHLTTNCLIRGDLASLYCAGRTRIAKSTARRNTGMQHVGTSCFPHSITNFLCLI